MRSMSVPTAGVAPCSIDDELFRFSLPDLTTEDTITVRRSDWCGGVTGQCEDRRDHS